MDPVTLSALIAGGISLAGTISNNIAQRKAVERQNEYNTPANQIARFQAAGLSPNLIYGSGQASAGNQTSLGDYQGLKVSTQDALNMANAILNFKNLDANTRKATAEAQQAEANATNANLDTQEKQIFLSQYNLQLQQKLEYDRLRNLLIGGQISLQDYQKRVQEATVRQINSQIALNEFQLNTGLPLQLAISQQNANTATQNMILAKKRFEFDSSFDANLNPLNFWNVNQRERDYHWTPVNNVSRIAMPLISGGLLGTVFRMGKGGLQKSGYRGSRGSTEGFTGGKYRPTHYENYEYGFYD